MADAFRANVSVTPIVTLTADADSNTEDVIHHDIKRRLGSKLNVSADDASGTGKWYYSAATTIVSVGADLIGGLKTGAGGYLTGSTTTYTDGSSYNLLDDVLAVYTLNEREVRNFTTAKSYAWGNLSSEMIAKINKISISAARSIEQELNLNPDLADPDAKTAKSDTLSITYRIFIILYYKTYLIKSIT